MIANAVVLLSGGLDSTAALAWALARYSDVRAIGISYGQPNRDAELTAGHRAADELGASYVGIAVADALMPMRPAGLLAGETSGVVAGVARAFVPGRNILFATIAAAHACTWWPGSFDIIIGAVAEDQATFPDCRPTTLALLAAALKAGCGREIAIRSPWADITKREILYRLQPDQKAYDVVRRSYSCYERKGPCGKCGACEKRAVAFASLGATDLSAAAKMTGGDPHREVA